MRLRAAWLRVTMDGVASSEPWAAPTVAQWSKAAQATPRCQRRRRSFIMNRGRGAHARDRRSSVATRVLFIGADALDKDTVLAWAEDGTLPTFRRLLREGAWGVTDSPPGLYVGAVWPSFWTSVGPGRHARYCYEQLQTRDLPERPHPSHRRPRAGVLGRDRGRGPPRRGGRRSQDARRRRTERHPPGRLGKRTMRISPSR